ncbi:MAG: hypothetical protein QMD04_00635 [Anaerolineales bacterium]|nr:hypothetical protein [Anaerolineales bacterium]
MERVIAYIDGYNLYYGLRHKQWKWFYWLNVQLLAQHLMKPGQELVGTKYFTTIVNYPEGRHRRQAVFKVVVAFPPARSSVALQRTAHGFYFIGRDKLSKSVFPDEVVKPDGFTLRRPAEWR